MQIDRITVTYGRKINLGNYNQAHLEIQIEAQVLEGEDGKTVSNQLWAAVKESVKEQSKALDEYAAKKASAPEPPPLYKETEGANICPVHNEPMTEQTTKDGKRTFWSHKTEDPRYNTNDEYTSWFCNGKPK